MALLVQILQGGESSRWYQRLVKEKELTLDLTGGLNYFGNEFDYTGPMIMTTRTTYKPGHTADEVIHEMDAVIADITSKGVTEKELADAKVRYRSNFYSQLESGYGKAHLLSALALFRDDPQQINSLLTPFENVTAAQVKAAAAKYLVATNRTVIDRVPEAKAQPKTGSSHGLHGLNGFMKGIHTMKTLLAIILLQQLHFAQQKTPPPPGAARPLNLPKITEKKLANGLTVVLAPLPNVPKVSAILTFRSATTASDRDAHPGIAQIAASVANEGTDTRTSKQIKEELRSIGGTLVDSAVMPTQPR